LSNDLDPATMNSGTSASAYYYLINQDISFSSYTVSVGTSGARNLLTIENGGGITASLNAQVGQGVEGDTTAGSGNSALVQGDGSMWRCSGNFLVGDLGATNTLTVRDGALVTAGTFYVGQGSQTVAGYGGANSVTVSGSDLVSVGYVSVGRWSNGNGFTANNGAKISSSALYVGWGNPGIANMGNDNSVEISDPGTVWTTADLLSLGNYGDSNTIQVRHGALLDIGTSIEIGEQGGTGNALGINQAIVVLHGDRLFTVNNLIIENLLYIVSESSAGVEDWKVAKEEDLSLRYFMASQADAAFSATGYSGLGDCSVVMSSNPLLQPAAYANAWSGDTTCNKGWYDSPWYGEYYSDLRDGGWLWHETHGWQFVSATDGDAVCMWDDATGSFWYINKNWYPAMYNYANERWYYYMDGVAPNRRFWDYTLGARLNDESTFHPL